MTTAAFFGDTHGHLKFMWQLAVEWQEGTGRSLDWIFQVGDFGIFPSEERLDPSSRKYAERHGVPISAMVGDFPAVLSGEYPVPIPTYFVRGNHEDQDFLLGLQKQRKGWYLSHPIEIVPKLSYVPDGCIFELGGLRIAGWGGCWSSKTFPMGYWSEKRLNSPRRISHMTRDNFERLLRGRYDLLVTHDGPTGIGLKGMTGAGDLLSEDELTTTNIEGGGVSHIRELIEVCSPRYSLSGHWHEYHEVQIGRTTHYALDKVGPEGDDRGSMVVLEL